jgi:hypothetical protein
MSSYSQKVEDIKSRYCNQDADLSKDGLDDSTTRERYCCSTEQIYGSTKNMMNPFYKLTPLQQSTKTFCSKVKQAKSKYNVNSFSSIKKGWGGKKSRKSKKCRKSKKSRKTRRR